MNEKTKVALSSVIAAVFLTTLKLVVGIATMSLGILSEALHSGLDLIAAIITFVAVKIADKPADESHHYGHGKVENLSALIETLILLITCGWIVYEAVHRLIHGGVEVKVTIYSFLVILISIVIDVTRSRVLMKTAKKYNSQALEADAYHFSSDILSSAVVIIGLICVKLGFPMGDAIAALGVSLVVVFVSIKLGKRTIDVLLDTAPKGVAKNIENIILKVEGVIENRFIRVRESGSIIFVDICVGLDKELNYNERENIISKIKEKIQKQYENSSVFISTYSIKSKDNETEEEQLFDEVRALIHSMNLCVNVHNIKIYTINEFLKRIVLHLEINQNISLAENHSLNHLIEQKIKSIYPEIEEVMIFIEDMTKQQQKLEDVTEKSSDVIQKIEELMNNKKEEIYCHNIHVYSDKNKKVIFLHCCFGKQYADKSFREVAKNIARTIKREICDIKDVFIHIEPMDCK